MKISRNWLQKYFDEPLPAPEELAELFTFHSFEVEGVEEFSRVECANDGKEHAVEDQILDLKILPDRAHYAQSHAGVAAELSAITGLDVTKGFAKEIPAQNEEKADVRVDVPGFCRRFTGRYISIEKLEHSFLWVETALASVGQRAINSIVDATNYVMLDIGQPLHAFDADKIIGTVHVRAAKEGERIALLDGREVLLTVSDHVIADDVGALDIAGVKGGRRAEIGPDTKRIFMTSCNFEPTAVRRTATRHNLRNEASKRFENEITPWLAIYGMHGVCAHIASIMPGTKFGMVVDVYPSPIGPKMIEISYRQIAEVLGMEVPRKDTIGILGRMGMKVAERDHTLDLSVPDHRLDLMNWRDIPEEVGRIYGYDKIAPVLPRGESSKPRPDKTVYYSERVKDVLIKAGFSEVYTYSLVPKGDYEIEKPLAADKDHLRPDLTNGVTDSLALNARNAELLGLDEIRIFEIGKVFTKDGEHTSLCIGIRNVKKKSEKEKEKIKKVRDELLAELGANATVLCSIDDTGGLISLNGKGIGRTNSVEGIMELDLDALVATLLDPVSYSNLNFGKGALIKYKPFSQYPFIVRDIAVFTPETVQSDQVWKSIEKGLSEAGAMDLVARHSLFDTFKKDGKMSHGFRIVFQSMERTLTDSETNGIMEKVYAEIKKGGWEVR